MGRREKELSFSLEDELLKGPDFRGGEERKREQNRWERFSLLRVCPFSLWLAFGKGGRREKKGLERGRKREKRRGEGGGRQ